MGTYIHFTDEQKERANSVDLEEFLRQRGEKLLRAGRESRLARVHHITVRGNEWYDHIARQGGHAVSFVQHYYGMSYQEAMELLLGNELGATYPAAEPKREEPPKPFALPPPNADMRRVYAYLMKQRRVSREVVTHFARSGLLYEDAQYHNCVFVGTDEQGVPRHAHKRSTNSQGKSFKVNVEGSKPQYSFHHVGQDGLLYVFEAPIDLLSFLTLYPDRWQEHSYVALCGTGGQAVCWMLEQHPSLQSVVLCLDHDEPGQTAARRLQEELQGAGYHSGILLPVHKDWNDDLVQGQSMAGLAMTMGQSMQAAEAHRPPGGALPLDRGPVHPGPPRRSHLK